MHKEDVTCTLFALMAGATVGAGVGLLMAPQSGPQLRSSLRDLTRKAKDHLDGVIQQGVDPDATMQSASDEEGIRMPGEECSTRSGSKNHTIGDTGQDN
jgi:gas vesicle protein